MLVTDLDPMSLRAIKTAKFRFQPGLNLNLPFLKNNRKGVLDAVLDWWKREKTRPHGPVPRSRLERQRDQRVPPNGDLAPYCQVAVWWLDQRLARMPA